MLAQFLDDTEQYDSISQYTDSTLPSEYVAQQIAHHNQDQLNDTDFSNSSERVQYVNIRVDAVNIFGENEGGYFSGTEGSESIPIKNLNEVLKSSVLKNLDPSQQTGNQETEVHPPGNWVRSKNYKKKIFIAFCVLLLIGIIVTIVSLTVKRPTNINSDQTSFIDRILWKADLGMIGSKALKVPVKRVIVKQSNGTQSCDINTCPSALIKEQFSSLYLGYDDIEPNFIIGTDGTIFEGRGFHREGQMTFDRFGTSYNKDSLNIEIICINNQISDVQVNSLEIFLNKFVQQAKIEKDYKLFYYDQLIQITDKNKNFYEKIKKLENFEESKKTLWN